MRDFNTNSYKETPPQESETISRGLRMDLLRSLGCGEVHEGLRLAIDSIDVTVLTAP